MEVIAIRLEAIASRLDMNETIAKPRHGSDSGQRPFVLVTRSCCLQSEAAGWKLTKCQNSLESHWLFPYPSYAFLCWVLFCL